ncbi:GTPase, G3E family [Halogranum amylolyticum]|uniref:GTPase, G3E family n=1 Tax=Halogranum amylolyticum TaxID=660520 RepID=A0A1H8T593_9EURY|nr:GTP-binding protein [Halogranum amylolyticum]SEO85804.1 GTPase, G3E family [Halogranum amylolyticum]
MNSTRSDGTIPVTVVSGYLGSGKTTLVNHLLNDPQGHEIAVVVNDMGEVNIDAELIADSDADADDGVIDLSNGCICCRLQSDLLTEVKRLAETRSFDYLLVEASGISEPIPIAQTFTVGSEESDVDPTDYYRLDTTVSVVDAYGFWKEFDVEEGLPDRMRTPDRPFANVLVDSIEFCDVLLLNKCDMVPDEELDRIEAIVEELQPRADIVRTEYSAVDPARVLGTGRFDFERAQREVGWKQQLAGDHGHDHGDDGNDHDHRSTAERHGVASTVYRRREPFHPGRLDAWLDDWDGNVVRAKGFFRLAGRPDAVMGLSQAGPSIQAGPIGTWDEADDPETRLVFIGTDLDADALAASLDDCLATAEEIAVGEFDDPFPTT